MQVLRVICPYCGQDAKLMPKSDHVYSRDYGPIYDCRPCDAYVGVHKRSFTPLGTPANRVLRAARRACHEQFDRKWQDGGVGDRSRAYSWLALEMGLPQGKAHIGMFNLEQCKTLLRKLGEDNVQP